jgi:WD40 repeat protein
VRSTSPFPFSTTQVGGRPAVFIDDHDSSLRLRDLTTDGDIVPPIPFASVEPYTAEVLDIDGRPVLVAAEHGGEISAVDVQTLTEVPVGAHGNHVSGLTAATVRGRPIAATIGKDGIVRRWDLRTRTPLGQPMPAPGAESIERLRTALVDGRTCLVTEATARNLTYVWDLETGQQVATPNTVGEITELAGAPVVVDASRGIVVTDLRTGTQLRRHNADPARVAAVAVVDGRPVVTIQGERNTILIRDIDTGAQLGAALEGHQADLTQLGVADLNGRPVLVSAAKDNTIRVWDLAVRAAG